PRDNAPAPGEQAHFWRACLAPPSPVSFFNDHMRLSRIRMPRYPLQMRAETRSGSGIPTSTLTGGQAKPASAPATTPKKGEGSHANAAPARPPHRLVAASPNFVSEVAL